MFFFTVPAGCVNKVEVHCKKKPGTFLKFIRLGVWKITWPNSTFLYTSVLYFFPNPPVSEKKISIYIYIVSFSRLVSILVFKLSNAFCLTRAFYFFYWGLRFLIETESLFFFLLDCKYENIRNPGIKNQGTSNCDGNLFLRLIIYVKQRLI